MQVLKNIEGLARFAQGGIPGYKGPLVGKKVAYRKEGQFGANTPRQVILSGGGGALYQAAVSGHGI